MRRKTYLASELRAGRTIFIVTRIALDHAGACRYQVAEHLIVGKHEPRHMIGGSHPYRMHPETAFIAWYQTDLWLTRRLAQREADRRQSHVDAMLQGRLP